MKNSRQASSSKTKKEIVDNETDRYTMGQFLSENISENSCRIDVASGYFNPSGFNILRKSLWEASKSDGFSMRLLFGKDAVHREYERSEVLGNYGVQTTFTEELDSLQIGDSSARLIDDLVSFLKQDGVQVRRNSQRFNHAKCYVLDDLVAVGSSNLTGSGLAANVGLNAILYQPSAQQQVRDWFERRWNEGEDAKFDLIRILDESKFGLPLEPFLAYMKFLYKVPIRSDC